MESKLLSSVQTETFIQWLVIFAVVGYFIYKEWPGFWNRVKAKAQGEQATETIASRLDRIEKDVSEIKEKLARDYSRIGLVEEKQERDHKSMNDLKTEQGIIMRALLGALSGLQELGANGSTEKAKEELVDYLNRQAHEGE